MTRYDIERMRPYKVRGRGLKPPSSNWVDIECPFCGTRTIAYVWSLCGSGKRCPKCKALHGSMGTTPLSVAK